MERLGLVEFVAVFSAHLISVQVSLSLPGCAIEEVHGLEETGSCDASFACFRGFHCIVMINTALVGY